MPDMGNLHRDVFLKDFLVAYTNEDYVAELVFPVAPVPKRSDRYAIINPDTFMRSSGRNAQGQPNSIRRPNTRSSEMNWDYSNQPFYAEQLAKSSVVTDAVVAYADEPLQPEYDATLMLTSTIMLDNEVAVAAATMTRANYASTNKNTLLSGSTSWAYSQSQFTGVQSSFPMSVDIPVAQRAVVKSGTRAPNRMLLNYSGASVLAANWEYRSTFNFVTTEARSEEGLAPIVRGMRPIVPKTQVYTSPEGAATSVRNYVWQDDIPGDACLFYYQNPNVLGLRVLTFGLTFEAPDDSLQARGFVTKRWLEPWRDAELIEVRTTRDWRFTATDGSTNGQNGNGFAVLGYLLSGISA